MGHEPTSKIRIIHLRIPQPGIIQNPQLLLVRLGNIREILLIARIHALRIRLPLLISKMIPIRRCERHLNIPMPLFGHNTLEELELPDVRALPGMADLALADHRLPRDLLLLEEGRDVRDVVPEDTGVGPADLGHAVQGREEGAPEHVPAVLAIAEGAEAAVLLDLDDLADGLVLDLGEVVGGGLLLLHGVAFVEEFGGAEEGA